jgi:hypothetical protein
MTFPINFFQPVSKLVRKGRHGGKVYRVYDIAHAPYQRLLRSGAAKEDKNCELADVYGAVNQVTLSEETRQSLEHSCTLAET